MSKRYVNGFLVACPLLLAGGIQAVAADAPGPVPQASTERFLNRVPDFAGGKPSPNILYSTRAVGEAANGPAASKPKGAPSVVVIDSGPASRPLSPSTLRGGTIERREITPVPIQPHTVTSPWNR